MKMKMKPVGSIVLAVGFGVSTGLLSHSDNASASTIAMARLAALVKCGCHSGGTYTVAPGASVSFSLPGRGQPTLVGMGISLQLTQGGVSGRELGSLGLGTPTVDLYRWSAIIPATLPSQTLQLTGNTSSCATPSYVIVQAPSASAPAGQLSTGFAAAPVVVNTPVSTDVPVATPMPISTPVPMNTPVPTTTPISMNTNVRSYLLLPATTLGMPRLHPRVTLKHRQSSRLPGLSKAASGQAPIAAPPTAPLPTTGPTKAPLIFG